MSQNGDKMSGCAAARIPRLVLPGAPAVERALEQRV